jgi:hypothetical protein
MSKSKHRKEPGAKKTRGWLWGFVGGFLGLLPGALLGAFLQDVGKRASEFRTGQEVARQLLVEVEQNEKSYAECRTRLTKGGVSECRFDTRIYESTLGRQGALPLNVLRKIRETYTAASSFSASLTLAVDTLKDPGSDKGGVPRLLRPLLAGTSANPLLERLLATNLRVFAPKVDWVGLKGELTELERQRSTFGDLLLEELGLARLQW